MNGTPSPFFSEAGQRVAAARLYVCYRATKRSSWLAERASPLASEATTSQ